MQIRLKLNTDDPEMVEIWGDSGPHPMLFAVAHSDLLSPEVLDDLHEYNENTFTLTAKEE